MLYNKNIICRTKLIFYFFISLKPNKNNMNNIDSNKQFKEEKTKKTSDSN